MGRKSRLKKEPGTPDPVVSAVQPAGPLFPSMERARPPVALAILFVATAAAMLPFAGKAFNFDDPLFLWAAKHIAQHWTDFYGFPVNWYGTTARMYDVMQNPPLTSYALALTGSLLGWSEPAMHLCSLLFAIAAVAGCWQLARRYVDSPLLAAILVLASPAFLVSATSVMSDVPMFACFVWAVVLWMRGIDEDRGALLWLAALLATASGLFKYFGVSVVLLLLAYGLLRRRSLGLWAVPLLLPVAGFAAWELATASAFGTGHLTAAMRYASQPPGLVVQRAPKLVVALAFCGGSALAALLVAPLTARRPVWAAPALLAAGFALVFLTGADTAGGFVHGPAVDQPRLALFIVFAAGGLGIFAMAAADWWSRRDADSALLVLWIAGTFVFAAWINWTVAVRSVLPLVAPVAILVVRRLERSGVGRIAVAVATALLAIVTLGLVAADARLAGSSREAAREITARYRAPGQTTWFEGHWGFQYYMQEAGAEPADLAKAIRPGDLWVTPSNGTNLLDVKPALNWIGEVRKDAILPLTTFHPDLEAGFYTDLAGGLPWSIGSVPPETFQVGRLGALRPPR